ncbi:hypothetical protein BSNK01_21080 [Bacillaceae bacterium]
MRKKGRTESKLEQLRDQLYKAVSGDRKKLTDEAILPISRQLDEEIVKILRTAINKSR